MICLQISSFEFLCWSPSRLHQAYGLGAEAEGGQIRDGFGNKEEQITRLGTISLQEYASRK